MIGSFVMGKAFLTGSTVYGTRTPASDVDMIVCVDEETLDWLLNTDPIASQFEHGEYDDGSLSLKVGSLNLILIEEECEFERWRQATENLKKVKPVSKQDAKLYFNGFVDGMNDDQELPNQQASEC